MKVKTPKLPKVTENKALTLGAIAFAAFSVYYVTRKPAAGPMSTQPAQQQRDAGLQAWHDLLDAQASSLTGAIFQSQAPIGSLINPAPGAAPNNPNPGWG